MKSVRNCPEVYICQKKMPQFCYARLPPVLLIC